MIWFKDHLRLGIHSTIVLSFFIINSGCNNNLGLNPQLSAQTNLLPPIENAPADGFSALTLSRVVKNTLDPGRVLDLVGDGSGAIGNLCVPATAGAGSASALTPTVCKCVFEYSSASSLNTRLDKDITYHENNLARCSYSDIPIDVTSLTVSIHITSSDVYSSKVNFKFNSSDNKLDLADASSFVPVIRYQCRSIINTIDFAFDNLIYDPFQSEDPHLSYPLDYYATNLGAAISAYTGVSGSEAMDANCPSILNPLFSLSPNAYTSYVAEHKVNLRLYSKTALGGNKEIFPTGGVKPEIDRYNFYLAKQKSGIFTVPVNAYQSPGVITSSQEVNGVETSANPPLGWGASPIPLGPGQETCPDPNSPYKPVGFSWAKLWLFRASLPLRSYSVPAHQMGIFCNPGVYSTTKTKIEDSCPAPEGEKNGFPGALSASVNNSSLADRVAGFAGSSGLVCSQLNGKQSTTSTSRLAFEINPADAHKTDATVNSKINGETGFTVAAWNSNGGKVPGVSISLTLVPAAGAMTGYTPQTTSSLGIATFTGIRIDTEGTYKLRANATGYAPTDSASFNIIALTAPVPVRTPSPDASPEMLPLLNTFCTGTKIPGPSCNSSSLTEPEGDRWLSFFTSQAVACGTDPNNNYVPTGTPNQLDVLNTFNSCLKALTTPNQSGLDVAIPTLSKISQKVIDEDLSSTKFDFLFVVSPVDVYVSHMQNATGSSQYLAYHPYRFFLDEDCTVPDPDNPGGASQCLSANAINNYGLLLHDVGSNDDPPNDVDVNGQPIEGSNGPRAGVFPVCVLQKD